MNGDDPLAQLRDIHAPSAIDWWPPAPGWWLLLLLAALAVTMACLWFWRRYRAKAYRRSAHAELSQQYHAWQQSGDGLAYLQAVNSILKRTALVGYATANVQRLSGERWCEFLDRQWSQPPSTGFRDGPLALAVYSNSGSTVDIPALQALADRWIHQHKGEQC
jgi:hypothetical protein